MSFSLITYAWPSLKVKVVKPIYLNRSNFLVINSLFSFQTFNNIRLWRKDKPKNYKHRFNYKVKQNSAKIIGSDKCL